MQSRHSSIQVLDSCTFWQVKLTNLTALSSPTGVVRALKGRNIILSSGAKSPQEMRAARNILSMAFVFGLTPVQAKVLKPARCRSSLALFKDMLYAVHLAPTSSLVFCHAWSCEGSHWKYSIDFVTRPSLLMAWCRLQSTAIAQQC